MCERGINEVRIRPLFIPFYITKLFHIEAAINLNQKGVSYMNPITYALFTYGLTAILSLLVIGVVVLTNKFLSRKEN